jgi:peptide/nickel transport system substrate-binding protein
MYPQDLDKAAKLFDEAGYSVGADGFRFKTTLTCERGVARTMDMAEVLRHQLKKVGIDIVIQPMDKAAMSQKVWTNSDFDFWIGSSSQGSDPATGIERMFTTWAQTPTTSSHNSNKYSNPEVDKLFKLAKSTMDMKKRGQYYREVQLLIRKDLPNIPLVDSPKFAVFKKEVKGVNEKRYWGHYYAACDGWFSK